MVLLLVLFLCDVVVMLLLLLLIKSLIDLAFQQEIDQRPVFDGLLCLLRLLLKGWCCLRLVDACERCKVLRNIRLLMEWGEHCAYWWWWYEETGRWWWWVLVSCCFAAAAGDSFLVDDVQQAVLQC